MLRIITVTASRKFTNGLNHSFTSCNTLQRGYLNTRELLRINYTNYNFIYLSTNKENTSAAVISNAFCY
jgi:gluconate kinase